MRKPVSFKFSHGCSVAIAYPSLRILFIILPSIGTIEELGNRCFLYRYAHIRPIVVLLAVHHLDMCFGIELHSCHQRTNMVRMEQCSRRRFVSFDCHITRVSNIGVSFVFIGIDGKLTQRAQCPVRLYGKSVLIVDIHIRDDLQLSATHFAVGFYTYILQTVRYFSTLPVGCRSPLFVSCCIVKDDRAVGQLRFVGLQEVFQHIINRLHTFGCSNILCCSAIDRKYHQTCLYHILAFAASHQCAFVSTIDSGDIDKTIHTQFGKSLQTFFTVSLRQDFNLPDFFPLEYRMVGTQ